MEDKIDAHCLLREMQNKVQSFLTIKTSDPSKQKIQDKMLSAKVFKMYNKNNQMNESLVDQYSRYYSLKEFFDSDQAPTINHKQFFYAKEGTVMDVETTEFFEVNLQTLEANNDQFNCLNIVNVSSRVRIDVLTVR